jgi:uncharacterized protein YukE
MVKASDPTIVQMLAAFDDCQGDCQRSYGSITNARASLQASWRSDEAAPTFFRAVDQWLSGFQKVRAGLDMLNGNMQQYRGLTVRTEADNTAQAGGWARP